MNRTKNTLAAFAALLVAFVVGAFALSSPSGAAAAPSGDPSFDPSSSISPVGPYGTDSPTDGPSETTTPPSGGGGGTVSGSLVPGGTATISGSGATPNGGVSATLVVSGGADGFLKPVAKAAAASSYNLGGGSADAGGNWSVTVTLPMFTGSGSVLVTDSATGRTLFSAAAGSSGGSTGGGTASSGAAGGGSNGGGANGGTNNGGAANGGTNNGGTTNEGATAYTGVATVGIGALGLALLIGGGIMLMAGRRRGSAHA